MQLNSLSSVSPSFTSHSSNNLADIAARVVEEFRNENGYEDDDDIYNFDNNDANHVYVTVDDEPDNNRTESEDESESDEEFEFDVVCTQFNNSSTASADEIFFNGEIVPRYPLFDRSLLLNDVVDESDVKSKAVRQRHPLRILFERESDNSCSSSEADELDGVAPETYCIWKPKSESVTKKSNSTGSSSKRWKFRNLVRRSNSDVRLDSGKNETVIVFRPAATKTRSEKVKKVEKTARVAGADDDDEPAVVTDVTNSGNRSSGLRSYLPYKPDLVGVFANVNGLSRNLHPF